MHLTPDILIQMAMKDPGLNQDEKRHLYEQIQRRENVAKFLSSASGAALGLVLAKYAKLGRTAQVLLGLAGFGAGRLLYNYLRGIDHEHDHPFAKYNEKNKVYQMDTRY